MFNKHRREIDSCDCVWISTVNSTRIKNECSPFCVRFSIVRMTVTDKIIFTSMNRFLETPLIIAMQKSDLPVSEYQFPKTLMAVLLCISNRLL